MPFQRQPRQWWPGLNRRLKIANGIEVAYPFWEPGREELMDFSGNRLQIEFVGADPEAQGSEYGLVGHFNGVNNDAYFQKFTAAQTPLFDPAQFTVMSFFRFDITGARVWFWAAGDLATTEEVANYRVGASGQVQALDDYGLSLATGSGVIVTGQWHCVVVRRRAADDLADIWVDGVFQVAESTALSLPDEPSQMGIGIKSTTSGEWNGDIGCTIVWGLILEEGQIKDISRDPWLPFRRNPVFTAARTPITRFVPALHTRHEPIMPPHRPPEVVAY